MTVADTITSLRSMGYKVELEDCTVKLSWKGDGKPNKEKVSPLIEYLKAHKQEAVDYLSICRTLEGMFKAALDRLNDACVKDPTLLDRYDAENANKATDRIEEVWKGCLARQRTVQDFGQVVSEWEEVAIPRI